MPTLTSWLLLVSTLLAFSPLKDQDLVPGSMALPPLSEGTLIGASPYLGGGLATDGRRVIYGEGEDVANLPFFNVLGIDLETRRTFPIATDEWDQSTPDVDDDYAVWYVLNEERQAIDAMHLPTGKVFTVSETQYGNSDPKISRDWVAWQHLSEDSDYSIMVRNVRTLEPAHQIYLADFDRRHPLRLYYWLDGGRILLYQIDDSWPDANTWVESWKISLLTLDDPESRPIVEGRAIYDYVVSPNGHTATQTPREGIAPPRGVDFAGSTLVYDEWRFNEDESLVVYDVDTGSRREIATYPPSFGAVDKFGSSIPGTYLGRGFVATDGQYVFWQQTEITKNEFNTEDFNAEVHGFDRAAVTKFTALGSEAQMYPVDSFWWMEASGGVLVWSNHGEQAPSEGSLPREIHAARILDLVPDSLKPTSPTLPTNDTHTLRYFPETGHTLQHGFLSFWERNGGLPVFGYPLTAEFREVPPDFGERFTVQYLERQRLEWHPEYAGTPYEVLLGRLGYDDAEQRGLLDTAPFQPRLADDGIPGHCTSFSKTGHIVCNEFDSYWASHGLELGDPGVSYRESLALFGYPISEAFVDPTTGLLTQYFERAAFELHPQNGPEYRVLLRRLGAETLPEFGLS